MNDVAIQKKSFGCGFWLMLTIICVLVFGGTGLWYYSAGKLEAEALEVQQILHANGQIIACDNLQVRGYPFRIGIFCDAIGIENKNTQQKLTSGALRTAAQIYDPGKFVVEFDGPAQFSDVMLGIFKINWQFLRASMRTKLGGIEHTSVAGHALTIGHEKSTSPLLMAETLEFHVRKLGKNNLDVAIGSRNLSLTTNLISTDTLSKPFNLVVELTANDLFEEVHTNQIRTSYFQKNGGSGSLNAFKLKTINGGILEIKGPLSVDTRGRLSGILDISVTKLGQLFEFFRVFFPNSNADLEQIELAVKLFSAGNATTKLQIQIEDGKVRVGLISLGRIPPLF
ncbi:MAG: DUF2125 domain-containing protein [Rhizobiaceae bacterium]|nr:DUF2125 domain-containing protein [Rhizobiaceae bacterium]